MGKVFRILAVVLIMLLVVAGVYLRLTDPPFARAILLKVALGGLLVLLGIVGLVVGLVLIISAALIVLMLLQTVGLAPRVPLGYNIRNLMVRWRITVLTGLAFTLVVGLMTVMLAWVNGMYAIT